MVVCVMQIRQRIEFCAMQGVFYHGFIPVRTFCCDEVGEMLIATTAQVFVQIVSQRLAKLRAKFHDKLLSV